MSDLFADVALFNRACDVRLRETPGWVSGDEVALALRLIVEERDELLFALASRNLVETADAIADSLYVRAGLLLRMGIARTYIHDLLPKAVDAPHWADFDATKTMAYIGDELEKADQRIQQAVIARDLVEVDVATHQSMYQISALAIMLHLPMDRVWAAVQSSNMAKLVDGKAIRREDGKILKPPTWQPPDIAGALGLGVIGDAA